MWDASTLNTKWGSSVSIQTILVFIYDGVSNVARDKKQQQNVQKPHTVWVVCYKLTAINLEHQGKPQLDDTLTYGVTSYGSGWGKDVVNQCLEL